MIIRKANLHDIDLLIELRIAYLLDHSTEQSLDDCEQLKKSLREYFTKAVTDDEFIAIIAEEEQEIYSTAFLSIAERPPRSATTPHQYKLLNLSTVDLLASSEGKPLYEKLGFQTPNYTFMRKII